jgi:hypothetical protein
MSRHNSGMSSHDFVVGFDARVSVCAHEVLIWCYCVPALTWRVDSPDRMGCCCRDRTTSIRSQGIESRLVTTIRSVNRLLRVKRDASRFPTREMSGQNQMHNAVRFGCQRSAQFMSGHAPDPPRFTLPPSPSVSPRYSCSALCHFSLPGLPAVTLRYRNRIERKSHAVQAAGLRRPPCR